MKRKHVTLLRTILFGAVLAAAIFGARRSEEQAPVSAETSAAAPTPDPQDTIQEDRSADQDVAVVYALSLQQSLSMGSRPSRPVSSTGVLRRARVASGAREEVEAISFVGDGLFGKEELRRPVFLVTDRRGRPLSVAFDRETSPEAKRLAKLLIAETQAIGPAQGERRWSTEELDATGVYAADYVKTAEGWHRTKRAYLRFFGKARAMQISGGTDLSIGTGGEITVLHTRERMTASMGESMPSMSGTLEVRMEKRGTEAVDRAALRALYARSVREDLVPGSDRADARRRKDESITRGAGYAEISGDLAAALAEERSDKRASAISAAIQQLSALVRLDRTAAERIAARALAPETSTEEVGALTAGLGAANTEQATHALEKILGGAKSAGARTEAAMAMAQTNTLTADSVEALRHASEDEAPEVAGAATLALGAAGRKTGGGEGADPVAELLDRWAHAGKRGDRGERALVLEALANSGDPRILPVLEEALAGADPELQAGAAFGLRFVTGADADAMLARIIGGQASSEVRQAAVRALSFRELAPWRAQLESAVGSERDPEVHALIEKLLARRV